MNRFLAVAAAAAATLALTPAAGLAQGAANGYYSAIPATATTKTKMITRATVWKCDANGCVAGKAADARDNIMCELVAREVGTLTAFRANGADFDAAKLAKCNTKAR